MATAAMTAASGASNSNHERGQHDYATVAITATAARRKALVGTGFWSCGIARLIPAIPLRLTFPVGVPVPATKWAVVSAVVMVPVF